MGFVFVRLLFHCRLLSSGPSGFLGVHFKNRSYENRTRHVRLSFTLRSAAYSSIHLRKAVTTWDLPKIHLWKYTVRHSVKWCNVHIKSWVVCPATCTYMCRAQTAGARRCPDLMSSVCRLGVPHSPTGDLSRQLSRVSVTPTARLEENVGCLVRASTTAVVICGLDITHR